MKRVLRQSEIGVALKCLLQHDFRYNQGIISPPRAALTVGQSVHAAIQHNFLEKLKTGKDAPLPQVLDAYSTDFDVRAKETQWGKDNEGKQKDLGSKLVELHRTKLAPSIKPKTVEEKFHLETDAGFDIAGQIDLVTQTELVLDHKTSKMPYASDAISRAVQPAIYDLAYESIYKKPAKGFRYDVLVKPTATKPASIQQVGSKVTPDDRQWALNTLTEVNKALAAGITTPAPEGAWWCSANWCGYWNRCKGKNRPVTIQVPAKEDNKLVDGVFPVRRSRK